MAMLRKKKECEIDFMIDDDGWCGLDFRKANRTEAARVPIFVVVVSMQNPLSVTTEAQ